MSKLSFSKLKYWEISLYPPKLASTWSGWWKHCGHITQFRNWLVWHQFHWIQLIWPHQIAAPSTAIRMWNDNPVTCFHLSKIGFKWTIPIILHIFLHSHYLLTHDPCISFQPRQCLQMCYPRTNNELSSR